MGSSMIKMAVDFRPMTFILTPFSLSTKNQKIHQSFPNSKLIALLLSVRASIMALHRVDALCDSKIFPTKHGVAPAHESRDLWIFGAMELSQFYERVLC